jgi:hypothetical protein
MWFPFSSQDAEEQSNTSFSNLVSAGPSERYGNLQYLGEPVYINIIYKAFVCNEFKGMNIFKLCHVGIC